MATWQTVRVFISSTFRDMHAERDHLVKTVFPALRERLAKYRVHLVDIDLRWGVTQEQSDNDLALDLCLQQIEDCRPFFIALLGERYGYVPKRFNQEALSRYGWVQHYTDKSITELEILHGVLRQPRMHDHAFFFFRDPAFKRDVPPPKRAEVEAEDAESAQNLERLKQDIRAARLPVPPVENYPCHYRGLRINRRLAAAALDEAEQRTLEQVALGGIVGPAEYARLSGRLLEVVNKEGVVYLDGLEAFGQRVHDQLWQAIQAELHLPEKPPAEAAAVTDPLAEEADYHERFMESRLRVYVGRESIQQQLLAYANSDETKPLLLTGPSGTGKSAVLARFVQSIQQPITNHQSPITIPHFIGASPNSTSLRQMLRRFCLTLRKEFGFTEVEVPEETNKLVSTFQNFLKRVPVDARVVIVIDALNQLDETDNAQALHWLPWQLPPNVKMVVSCIAEAEEINREDGKTGSSEKPSRPRSFPVQPNSAGNESEQIHREDGKSGSSAEPSRPRACPVQPLQAFQHRPHIRLQVEPLTDAERQEIVRAVPSLSAKTLDDAQIALLLENPATRNPLFLLVSLEELRGFGSFERLNDRIRALPREGDTLSAIFQQVIERLEEEFDPTLVCRLLSLLACARIGLSEKELQELLGGIGHGARGTGQAESSQQSTPPCSMLHAPCSDNLYPVLRQLRPYLQYRGTLVDFYHRNLFKAVRERYLAEDDSRRLTGRGDVRVAQSSTINGGVDAADPSSAGVTALQAFHRELAGYFRSKADPANDKQWKGENPRPFLEVAFHLTSAQRWDEICQTLCNLRFVEARCRLVQVFELIVDYRVAQENLPEVQADLCEERAREARMQRWTAEIIEYARQWSDRRDRLARGETVTELTPKLPELVPTREMGSEERTQAECERIIRTPTRRDRLEAFAGFVSGQYYPLLEYGQRPDFVLQHAFNAEPAGAVHDAASSLLVTLTEPHLLRRWPTEARPNPRPVLVLTLEGHNNAVYCVSVTPDGRRAVSASVDCTLRLWDLESGACLRTLDAHTAVTSVSVMPDGRRAISGYGDGTLRVWDLESGACLRTLEGHNTTVGSVSVTPDGRRAVSVDWYRTLRAWNLTSGECLFTIDDFGDSVTVTPDGRYVVSGGVGNALRMWDIENRACLRTLEGHSGSVTSVSVVPNARRAVSGSNDRTLRVWDLANGACLWTLKGHTKEVRSVALTSDGRRAVSGSWDKTIRVWDLESGKCLRVIGVNSADGSVSVTPDAWRAVSGGGRENSLRVWDLNRRGDCLQAPEVRGDEVASVSVTPDGRRAVSGDSDGTLRAWDTESGACLWTMKGKTEGAVKVSVTPDGRRAVSWRNDRSLRVWDLENGTYIRTLEGHSDAVVSVSVMAFGRRAVSASYDKTIRFWDLDSGTCLRTICGHRNMVRSVCVSPDERRAVSGSDDRTLRVWDLDSGVCLRTLEGHSSTVDSVIVTPDGKGAVSGSWDETIRVWNLETGACLRVLEGHRAEIHSLIVAPDGRRAVSSATGHKDFDRDKVLRVWDLESGTCLRILEGHSHDVTGVVVTPDGRSVVSWSRDKTLRIWDLLSGQCLAVVAWTSLLNVVAYAAGLNRLITGSSAGDLAVFDIVGFSFGPAICTAVRSSDPSAPLATHCACCGEKSAIPATIANTIVSNMALLQPEQSPCLDLPAAAFDDPRLLGTCPHCSLQLKFNPFFVDCGKG